MPVTVPAIIVIVAPPVVVLAMLLVLAWSGGKIIRNYGVASAAIPLSPDHVRSDLMIFGQEMDVHRVDHLHVARGVLLPVAVSSAVRRSASEIVDVRIEPE